MMENKNMKWYKIHLTNVQVIEGVHVEIQKQFTALWLQNGSPADAAMFDDLGMGVEGLNIYFSPGSCKFILEIINQYYGEEIERPNDTEVALLVGNDNAWNLFK